LEFVSFQSIDARQNVGIPIDGIDAVAFGCSDERKMNSNCFRPFVGACEKTIFSYEDPRFDGPFTLIVIDSNIRILQESCKSKPVLEGIAYRLHQLMGRIEFVFCPHNNLSEKFCQRLGFLASNGQPESWRLVVNVPFNFVQVSVDAENCCADVPFADLGFEVFAPGVSAATGFNSFPILKQCVEAPGGVSLDNTGELIEEFEVFAERQIRRMVVHGDSVVGVTHVRSNFAFANIVFVATVLDLNRRVVGLDDAGLEEFLLLHVMQQRKSGGSGLHPIALSRARNHNILAREDLLLTIVGKPVIKFADDDLCQQAWTGVATRNCRTGLFSGDDILLAFWTRASLLTVVEDLQGGADHFKLMCDQVADEHGFDDALGADQFCWFNRMCYRLVGHMLGIIEYVLNAGRFLAAGRSIGSLSWFLYRSRARVILLGLFAVLTLVAFFRLRNQNVDFRLQIFEQFALFVVAVERLLQLSLQVFNHMSEALNFRAIVRALFSESYELFVILVRHVNTAIGGNIAMIPNAIPT
jgi:hypothetical protein